MSKILFLEDRPQRQKLYLPNHEKDIDILLSIKELEIPQGPKCKVLIDNINTASFNLDDYFKLILIHKSSLNAQGLINITRFCKENNINLILFSGNIGQLNYINESFELLNINSSDLYTDRLIPFINDFINDKVESLLELIYDNWRLTYLLLLRQLLTSKEYGNENDVDRFEHKIENIKQILSYNSEINKENINEIIDEILISL